VRPALDKSGRLITPASYSEAIERAKQLRYECSKIQKQLQEPSPFQTSTEWRQKATLKLNQFHSEERQLGEWLVAGEELLKSAHQLLVAAYAGWTNDWPELEELIEKLDERFGATKETTHGVER